jgi:RNA polymerase sigma-70 factor (ECF subfamily)
MPRSAPDRREPTGPAAAVLPLVRKDAVDRARRGDVAAFEELYRAHVARVYALCLRLSADRTRAEDATQEVFVKAWRSLPGFEGRSAFSTWLHRLAVNVVLDARRSEGRRGEVLAGAGGPGGSHAEPASREPSPDVGMDLERAIASLPEPARTAFVLHDVEGFRHREIAGMTGVAEGTWRARLHLARRMLRERLAG